MKTENLKRAYALLKDGKTIDCNGCKIWITFNRWSHGFPVGRKKCIKWIHYGSAAVDMGINNLRWVFKTIADSENYEFSVVE